MLGVGDRFVLSSQKRGARSASLERAGAPRAPPPRTASPAAAVSFQLPLLPPPLAEFECRVQIENTPRIEKAYKLQLLLLRRGGVRKKQKF